MSRELVENLYQQMTETENSLEANVIKNMYDGQDYKNPTITEFFNKKYAELKINEISKLLNKENVGLVTDCRIDIVSMDNRTFPVLTVTDKDKNSLQIGLSIGALGKLSKQVDSTKAGLSLLQYVGI